MVIADNCTDHTAAIARREGATVLERRDPTRKSKGYAIEYLIDRLRESRMLESFDALVVVDADSTVCQGLLGGFAALVEAGHDWIQCFYTVSNADASRRTRLLTYAFSLFNGVTLMGQSALGLSAGLRGNGMCISTRGLQRVPWDTHGLAEDFEYSWKVRAAGGKVSFLPGVRVQGLMSGQWDKAAAVQRQRWESGRYELRRQFFLPLLRSRHLSVIEKIASLLELTMPSMVPLLTFYTSILVANLLVLSQASAGRRSASVLVTSMRLMSLAVGVHAISPFLIFALSWSYLSIVTYLPFYALWKFTIALRGRPSQWLRTPREQPINQ